MTVNYRYLDELLGPHMEAICKDPQLGRLHDELKGKIRLAQDEFDKASINEALRTFASERLAPEVKVAYRDLASKFNAHRKTLLPDI